MIRERRFMWSGIAGIVKWKEPSFLKAKTEPVAASEAYDFRSAGARRATPITLVQRMGMAVQACCEGRREGPSRTVDGCG